MGKRLHWKCIQAAASLSLSRLLSRIREQPRQQDHHCTQCFPAHPHQLPWAAASQLQLCWWDRTGGVIPRPRLTLGCDTHCLRHRKPVPYEDHLLPPSQVAGMGILLGSAVTGCPGNVPMQLVAPGQTPEGAVAAGCRSRGLTLWLVCWCP